MTNALGEHGSEEAFTQILRAFSPSTAETGFPPKVLCLLQMSQANGIHILALPPHTLDESVNGYLF